MRISDWSSDVCSSDLDAWERAGGAYYPKLQIAAPFTPVPGPRLLARGAEDAALLIRAAEAVVRQNNLSSAHATFVAPEQMPLFEAAGWLVRRDVQDRKNTRLNSSH